MTDTLARPRSPIAVAAAALSLLVALAALLSGLGSRWGLWNFGMGFKILDWSARCAIAVAVLSLVAVLLTRPGGSRRGFSFALLGLVVSLVVVGIPYQFQRSARSAPPIHDTNRHHTLKPFPVVVMASFPCFTPLMLISASATFLISAPLPFTTSTSRQ